MKQRETRRLGGRLAAVVLAIALAVGGGVTAAADGAALDPNTPVAVSGTTYGPVEPSKPYTVSAPNAVVKGQPIVITGTGYLHPDGTTGSVAAFLIDAEFSGDPKTLYTKRQVTHPVTGAVASDKRLHALTQANSKGAWSVSIPWPSEANTDKDSAFFAANWKVGTTHSVRILTGSQLAGDYQRGISVSFTVVDKAEEPVAKDPKIALTRTSVEQGDHVWFDLSGQKAGTVATELINASSAVVASASFQIGADGRIVNKDGQTYQRVTVPRTAAPGQYRVRVVSGGVTQVISAAVTVTAAVARVYNPGDHEGGAEDLFVQKGGTWTFRATSFAKNGTLRATAVVGGKTVTLPGIGQISATNLGWKLDANGDAGLSSYARVQLPAEQGVGSFAITFTDGTVTVKRTLTIQAAPVSASVQVAASAEIGGKIRVTGKGFLHPTSKTQGSRIAVKINDGAYSRLDTSVHTNKTIWYLIDAKKDGTFSVDIPLPDGTKSGKLGSSPALVKGTYTLRFLTGSLLTGDTSRTVESAKFTVVAKGTKKLTSTSTPTVSGTKKVGKTLKASVKAWQPATVALKYQWLRDGKAISKATSSSYTLTKADAGKKVSVKVTGSKSGYVTVSKTSKTVTVAKVKSTVKITSLKAVKQGKQATVKVTIGSAVAKPTGTVRVTVNGKSVSAKVMASAKGKVSIKLPKIGKKGSYKVKAVFTPSGATAKSTSKSSTVTKTLKVT